MSDAALQGLRDVDADALIACLRFFRSKRDLALQTVEAEFADAQSDRLVDDREVFSAADVEDVLNGVRDVVLHSVRADMSRTTNMMALLLKQLLTAATTQGAELELSMTAVEDQALLDAVERLNVDRKDRSSRSGKLTSLADEHLRLQGEAERLNSTNTSLARRFENLQNSHAALEKERTGLTEEVLVLRNQLRLARGDVAEAKGTHDELKGEVLDKEAQLRRDVDMERRRREEAEEENEKRINQTRQFKQLKDMLQQKNGQIKELRARLAQYEAAR